MVARVSGCEKMYQSRLLSCPTYFCQISGGLVPSNFVSKVERYQRVTISTPSGFSEGTSNKIVLSRMVWKRGLVSVISRYANSTALCVEATSSAWIEHVIRTMFLPSLNIDSACAGDVMRGSARRP